MRHLADAVERAAFRASSAQRGIEMSTNINDHIGYATGDQDDYEDGEGTHGGCYECGGRGYVVRCIDGAGEAGMIFSTRGNR